MINKLTRTVYKYYERHNYTNAVFATQLFLTLLSFLHTFQAYLICFGIFGKNIPYDSLKYHMFASLLIYWFLYTFIIFPKSKLIEIATHQKNGNNSKFPEIVVKVYFVLSLVFTFLLVMLFRNEEGIL